MISLEILTQAFKFTSDVLNKYILLKSMEFFKTSAAALLLRSNLSLSK